MITRIKVVNHKILSDFEINLTSKLVRIVGYNGKGKSFLLSLLSPYPNAIGYGTSYPIKDGECGLFEMDIKHDSRLYTVRFEYTPNSRGTHSAKCYMSYIDNNGDNINMNFTGNVDSYKALVAEYLDYDRGVDIISNLNWKSCGVGDASPEERLSLFKLLIREDMDKLYKYNKIISGKHTYNAAILTGRRKELAAHNSIEELNSRINNTADELYGSESNLTRTKDRMSQLKDNISKLEYRLADLEKYNIEEIRIALRVIRDSSYKTVGEYRTASNSLVTNMNLIGNKIEEINNELSQIDMSNITIGRDSLEDRIKELKKDISKFTRLSQLEDTTSLGLLIDTLISLARSLDDNTDVAMSILSNYSIDVKLEDVIKDIKCKITELTEERANCVTYELKDFEFAVNKFEPKANDCDNCELNLEFEKYLRNRRKNLDNINRMTEIDKSLVTLRESLDNLNEVYKYYPIYNNFIYILSTVKDKAVEETLDRFKNFNELVSSVYLLDKAIMKLHKIKDNTDNYISMHKNLEALQKTKSATSSDIVVKFDILNRQLKGYIEEFNLLKEKKEDYFSLDDNVSDLILHMDRAQLDAIAKDKDEVTTSIKSFTNQLGRGESEISGLEKKIRDLRDQLVKLRIEKNKVSELSETIIALNKDATELTMLRQLISKHIPLDILRGISTSVRNDANNILSESGVDISIDILLEDKNIVIPVLVRDSLTPEAKLLSSGETALVGLALNSAIKSRVKYPILRLDEIDANLDIKYAERYISMIDLILNTTNVSQVFIISHRMRDLDAGEVIVIGDYDISDMGDIDPSRIIRI